MVPEEVERVAPVITQYQALADLGFLVPFHVRIHLIVERFDSKPSWLSTDCVLMTSIHMKFENLDVARLRAVQTHINLAVGVSHIRLVGAAVACDIASDQTGSVPSHVGRSLREQPERLLLLSV